MTTNFIPGLKLCGLFYGEIIKPILDLNFPNMRYSAALIGAGSEVLGFDTEMSSDHDWGPRIKLFLDEDNFEENAKAIEVLIKGKLPNRFRNYPVQWTIDGPSGNVCVELLTIRSFFLAYLNFDIRGEIRPADWLTFPEQKLRTVISGEIYRDDLGLQAIRERFGYYPHDVWLYLMAAQWQRIGQEEHLMGRAGMAGDEIGSALIAARLVRDLMRLCFLMEKQYPPYAKWFGTAFARLAGAEVLMPLLSRVLVGSTWLERQEFLVPAYEIVAARHNELEITEALTPKVSHFHGRPFLVIDGGRFAGAIRKKINDPVVKRIAERWLIGNVDQFSDSTDLLDEARSFRSLFE
ncbi:MAG TPA: DUF4037 domain-containing protein [Anaerolineales bacterium]|nr:DUF4037 domain-containing protein [Anaerolineales bacterium]